MSFSLWYEGAMVRIALRGSLEAEVRQAQTGGDLSPSDGLARKRRMRQVIFFPVFVYPMSATQLWLEDE